MSEDWSDLNILSLSFIPAIESLYYEVQLKQKLVPVDKAIGLFKLSVTVLLVASYAVGLAPTTPMAAGFWLLYTAILAAQSLLIAFLPAYYSSQRKLWLAPCFKLGLAGCLLGLIPSSVLQPIDSTGSYTKVLLLGSGVVALNCTGIFIPMLWAHHVPMSLAMLAMFTSVLPATADTLLCAPFSRRMTSSLYNSVDTAAQHFSSLMLPLPVPVAASAAADGPQQEAEAHPSVAGRAEAYALLLWLQLFVGLLAPAVYTYCSELRSRAVFLQQLSREFAAAPNSAAASTSSSTNSNGGQTRPVPAVEAAAAAAVPLPGHDLSSDVHTCGLLPPQPRKMLLVLMALAAVVLWNVLALTAGQLGSWIDGFWGGGWVDRAATDAFAGSCIRTVR